MSRVDTQFGFPLPPEITGNFFRGVGLGDFYGKMRPVASDTTQESSAYAHITEWLPYHAERQLILRLAQSLAGEKRKPLIIDAGCGSGAITKILAADGLATCIGIDFMSDKRGSTVLPPINGADIRSVDLWDALGELSPQFPSDISKERQELLRGLRERIQTDPVFAYVDIFGASGQIGDPEAMNENVRRLQELAQLRTAESPVDLVVCSYMPSTADLTIAIRDGIHPKAIVYVFPNNGMSGAGDYYITEYEAGFPEDDTDRFTFRDTETDVEPTTVNPNTVISYNPGTNYHTAVRWSTTWQNNWFRRGQGFGRPFDSEVAIQLRNDVQIQQSLPPHIEKYPLDLQLENGFMKPEEKIEFLSGIQKATTNLFGM